MKLASRQVAGLCGEALQASQDALSAAINPPFDQRAVIALLAEVNAPLTEALSLLQLELDCEKGGEVCRG